MCFNSCSRFRASLIYINNCPTRCTTKQSIYFLQVHSTCFGCQPHPSSGVHKTVTSASGTVQLPPSNVARRRDLYLPTRNIYKRQTFNSPAGFEPAIPASERPQTHASDNAVTRFSLSVSVILNSLPRSPTTLLRSFAVGDWK